MSQHGLSPRIVTSLDAARALAALYVVAHHVAQKFQIDTFWLRFGQEAVLVFFLLSGFVIFANERNRAHIDYRGYYLRRFLRIYPPLIAAMALSSAIAIDNGDFTKTFNAGEFVGTLLSLQDVSDLKPGVLTDSYMGNTPLWSLSYEVAFYLAFPWVLRAWRSAPRTTSHLVGLVSCASYVLYLIWPNHFALVASYFLVWWVGASAAAVCLNDQTRIEHVAGPILWLVALTLVAGLGVLVYGYNNLGTFPFLQLRHFGFALLVILLAFSPLTEALSSASYLARGAFGALASISYGLYVLHYPLLIVWERAAAPVGFAISVLLLVVGAVLFDQRLTRLLSVSARRSSAT